MRLLRIAALVLLAAAPAGCAAGRPDVPYPAFIQADELPDVFMAALPGVRAKQFAGSPQTRRSSNRITLPPDWQGTTGASPGKSLELYVLEGEITVGRTRLDSGGYAWFPPGDSGANLKSSAGAVVLYFLDDANPDNAWRTPIIVNSNSAVSEPLPDTPRHGMRTWLLRHDPGSGARTWVLEVAPSASIPWQLRRQVTEGYLISGEYEGTECVAGRPVTGTYSAGGYFHRPAETVHGGPSERAVTTSVWLLRASGDAEPVYVDGCRQPGG